MLANFTAPELVIPADVPRRLIANLDVEARRPTRVRVWADVEHTDTTDLRIVAIAPDGVETVLHDRHRFPGQKHAFSADAPLGRVGGLWSLRVDDVRGGDGGRVSAWGVEVVERSSGFAFDVVFEGEWSSGQRDACLEGLAPWERAITTGLDPVELPDGWVESHRVTFRAEVIDGPGGTLGMSGPTSFRWVSRLPASSIQTLDVADRDGLHDRGALRTVVTHESGHGLGLYLDLLPDLKADGLWVGKQAVAAFAALGGDVSRGGVPLETGGGRGTAGVHLSEEAFASALMTGWIGQGDNPLTTVSIAALGDHGYSVDLGAADAYVLPSVLGPSLAERGWRSCCAIRRPEPETVGGPS